MGRKPKSAEVRARFFTARASARDVAGGGSSSRHFAHGGALLAGPVGRRAPAREAAAAGATALDRGAGGDLPRPGAEEDADRDRRTARPLGVDGVAGGAAQQRPQRLPCGTCRPAGHDPDRTAEVGQARRASLLREYVEDKLTQCWSPRQISRRLLLDHPDDPTMQVLHETIYTSLFVQTKALLRTKLTTNLRSRRVRRRPQRRVNPTATPAGSRT